MPNNMKLKERLVAASLGFMAAICLLVIGPLVWPPFKPHHQASALSASSSVRSSMRQQRNLQKTDSSAGQSEQQTNVSEHDQDTQEEWSVLSKQQKTVGVD